MHESRYASARQLAESKPLQVRLTKQMLKAMKQEKAAS
jgi:hypothetical protein